MPLIHHILCCKYCLWSEKRCKKSNEINLSVDKNEWAIQQTNILFTIFPSWGTLYIYCIYCEIIHSKFEQNWVM